jgi:hypothetical protein
VPFPNNVKIATKEEIMQYNAEAGGESCLCFSSAIGSQEVFNF